MTRLYGDKDIRPFQIGEGALGHSPQSVSKHRQGEREQSQQGVRYLDTESQERRPELGSFLTAVIAMVGGIVCAGKSGQWRLRWQRAAAEMAGVLLIVDGTVGFLVGLDLWSILRWWGL
jgi:hypothetical protein